MADIGSEQGTGDVLEFPQGKQPDLREAVKAGRRRLKALLGATTYSLIEAKDASITDDQLDAANMAVNLFAAQWWRRTRGQLPMSTGKGTLLSTDRGGRMQESHAGPDLVARTAGAFGTQALEELRLVGLWSGSSTSTFSVVEMEAS